MTTPSWTELDDPVRGDSEPNRYWSTTNVAEATSDILSPLCWSVWGDGLERAWLRSMGEFGLLSRSERQMSSDMNRRSTAAIYGRQAANVGVLRAVLARFPGVTPDDVERDLLGSARPGIPQEPGAPARLPLIAVRLPYSMLTLDRKLRRMYAEHRQWWQRDVHGVTQGTTSPQGDPVQRLLEASDRFAAAMYVHAIVRFLLPAAEGAVNDAAVNAGVGDLVPPALAGFGNVTETVMADHLWRVGRGESSVAEFLAEYGYHGPNEGNVYTRSWREQPERVDTLVAGYRNRANLVRPLDREAASTEAGSQAQAALLAALPATKRPTIRFMLRRCANLIRKLELGKAAYLMALDGCRAAARDIGADLVARGTADEVDDAFFLTVAEHIALDRDDSADPKALVAYRRGTRQRYAAMTLPVTFTGMPVPIAVADDGTRPAATEVTGKASGGGQVEGRARVVLDPNEDVELNDGDILVCRFTDPSWAPLFTLAEALVIDIGSNSSHGAVVARELGIPYVIGTGNGTSVIHDGYRVLVDGQAGIVKILASDSEATERPAAAVRSRQATRAAGETSVGD